MSLLQRILVSVTATFIVTMFYATDAAAQVSPNCLDCLCEAASKCDLTTKCHTPYPRASFCGPFHLSWAYWVDAGRQVISGDDPAADGSFVNCAENLDCATNSVRQYMNNYAQDCDGDGRVTCRDYIKLHKLGKNLCSGPLQNDRFTQQFEECAARLNVQ